MSDHTLPESNQENIEEWRDVPGYEGYYQVSSFGRVRSMDRKDARGRHRYSQLLRPGTSNGYPFVHLHKGGRGQALRVHLLVASAFIGERPVGYTVNHIDGVKSNNYLSNLEYLTHEDNIRHAADLGLMGKLSTEQVWEVREAYANDLKLPYTVYAEKFGVCRNTIADVVRANRREGIKNRDGSTAQAIDRHRLDADVYSLYKSGLSLNEIARRNGVNVSTVSRAYHKAVRQREGYSAPLTTKRG